MKLMDCDTLHFGPIVFMMRNVWISDAPQQVTYAVQSAAGLHVPRGHKEECRLANKP